MTQSDVEMLKGLHQMSRGDEEPQHGNRKERRAAAARKRKKKKKISRKLT